MSTAPTVNAPPNTGSRSGSRRGSYLEQLLTEHPTTPPEPTAARPAAPTPLAAAEAPQPSPVATEEPSEPQQSTPTPPVDVATTDGATTDAAAAGVAAAAEVRAAVAAAGALIRVRTRTGTDAEIEVAGTATETETADCLAACTRTALSPRSSASADWTVFGTVIPVLAGHPGGGASVLAAVLADALAAQGHRVLLVDAADPLRSGLADATTDDGPRLTGPHRSVGIRQSGRGPIRCARLEYTGVPVRSAGMVPAPQYWTPPDGAVDVTVVDIGWDAWALGAMPLQGPGGWLRHGTPTPRPVLALRPSMPAARHTEQLLSRLAAWTSGGGATEVTSVVVMGAKKVPPALRAVAGNALTPLLQHAVCLPTDRDLAERGVSTEPTPAPAQHAVAPLLTRWDLLANAPASATTRPGTRKSLLRRTSTRQEETTP